MRKLNKILCAIAGSSLFVCSAVKAGPLIQLSIEGSTSQGGSYSGNMSVHSGETVYVEVFAGFSGNGTADGSKTINNLVSGTDGISSLNFNLGLSGIGSGFVTTSGTYGLGNSSVGASANWASGTGPWSGNVTSGAVTDIRPITNPIDSNATFNLPGDVVWFGKVTVGSAATTTIGGSWYNGGFGGAKYNNGANLTWSNATETGANPIVGYNSLTLTESTPVAPEPSILGGVALAAGLGVFQFARRRRTV